MMVYDNTLGTPEFTGESGYAIHKNVAHNNPAYPQVMQDEMEYELYSDDGRGNGNFICASNDLYWIRTIAKALDRFEKNTLEEFCEQNYIIAHQHGNNIVRWIADGNYPNRADLWNLKDYRVTSVCAGTIWLARK